MQVLPAFPRLKILALLLGAALAGAPAFSAAKAASDAKPAATSAKKAAKPKASGKKPAKATKAAKAASAPGPLADFRGEAAPDDVTHVANWVSYSRNHGKRAFVIIDKKQAQLYVFDPKGKFKSRTPVLLGKAVGDRSAPGVGNKPLAQLKEEEKTTPAGRFLAARGKNLRGEDILWIDYASAVSMHRLRSVPDERRGERMASAEVDDNRISNGCVNVPPRFYNSVLKPTVLKYGAFVYVLPETTTPQQLFGSYDVPPAKKSASPA
jgi:hypothetical protein